MWNNLRPSQRRALIDLAVIGAAALLVLVVGFALDLPAKLYGAAGTVGAGRGEIGFVLGVLLVGLAVFAARRWLDHRRAQAEFQSMFENAPVGVFRSTAAGRFLMVNPAMARMLGYDAPAEVLDSFKDISKQLYVNPERRVEYLNALERDGVVREFETRVYRRDGSIIWILGNGRAERDASGKILYIEGNVQDITARKETEGAYEQLIEQSLQGITIRQEGRLAFCNRAAAEQLGYTIEEMLAMSPTEFVALWHPDDREMLLARERDRLQGRSVPSHYVFQVLRKDGAARWLEASVSLMEHRGVPALLVITVDVTERKAAQDAMQLTLQRTRLREETSAALARGGNDLDAVLNLLTRVVGGLLGDICVATLRSADGKWVEPLAYAHARPQRQVLAQQMYKGLRLPYDHPALGRVFTEGVPLLIPHLDSAQLTQTQLAGFGAFTENYKLSSYLIVPMRDKGAVIGSLSVVREQGGAPYTLDDQTLLQELADRATLAVSNAQLVRHLHSELDAHRAAEEKYRSSYQLLKLQYARTLQQANADRAALQHELDSLGETDTAALLNAAPLVPAAGLATAGEAGPAAALVENEQRAFAEALGDAAALLTRASDADQVLDGLLDTVARIVPYETASIFIRDGAVLRLVRARGFEKYGLEEWVRGVTFSAEIPKFKTMVEQGVPVIIPDTRTEAGWVDREEMRWFRSNVAAPLRLGADTVGMIGLDSTVPNFYRADHAARLITFADLAATAMRHAQLLSETQQRARQLSLLYDVGLTLNRVLEARTQLEFLFKIALRALRADDMAYFSYHPRTEMVTYDLGVGLAPELEEHLRSNPFSARQGQGVVGWIAKQRLPALVPKVKDDPRWIQLTRLTQSVVGVPVEHEKELRGVLMAGRTQDVPFTAQDERLLILFANQVAAAMELTRLFQAQKQRQHELEILREASLAFAAASDRATLANLILQFSLRLVTAQNAFLFFYENEELEYGGMLWAQDSPMPPQRFTPRREGLTYTVAQSGRMVVIDDVNSHPLFSSWRWGGAIIGLPLKAGGEVRAVLNVAHEQPHQFATEELHALELFADQAAAALENARRFQEMEREIERLSLPEHAVAAAGSARQSHDWRNE